MHKLEKHMKKQGIPLFKMAETLGISRQLLRYHLSKKNKKWPWPPGLAMKVQDVTMGQVTAWELLYPDAK